MLTSYAAEHESEPEPLPRELVAKSAASNLADIIAKKRQNPDYQHRPQLYDPSMIPTGRITGVDDNAQATIEFESGKAK
jgi:hypothetical protein